MNFQARQRLTPREGALHALPPSLLYLGLGAVMLLLLPDKAWRIRPHFLIVVGLLGIWRYSWMFVHIIRAIVFQLRWFPRVRRRANALPDADAFPDHLYFLIPTYKEKPWISQQMLHAVLRECVPLPCPTTLLIACKEGEDQLFMEILQRHPSGDAVEVVIMNQAHGKRVGMGDALRALCRRHDSQDALVVFMDGDTVLGPQTLRKTLPLFKLFPRLGAATTDEMALVDGPRWYRQWYELRFSQRHRLMKSLSLSRRVLTLTGRFSVFRAELAVQEDFIRYLEDDHLDHWLYGNFRFLTGDDKSTWFQLLREGWEMLYVPDALVFCMEGAGEQPLRQSVAKMHRWFGNMLRNNGRAIRLGPKPMGFFIWWCLVDQRLSMWTTLVGPLGATLLAVFESPYYFPFYLFGAISMRLVYLFLLALEGHKMSLWHLPQLFYTQWMGALVKVWVVFRLDRQTWGSARGGMTLEAAGGAPRWIKRQMPRFQTGLFAAMFVTLVCLGVGVIRIPYATGLLFATPPPELGRTFVPGTAIQGLEMDVAEFGVAADDGLDDARRLQYALDSLPPEGRAIIRLPPGRLLLQYPVTIRRNDTWLVGAGRDRTELVATFRRELGEAAISIEGEGRRRSDAALLTKAVSAGERILHLDRPTAIEEGRLIWVGAANDAAFLRQLGSERWSREYPWLRQALVQVSVFRETDVLLTEPLSFMLPYGARIEPVHTVRGVRLEGFTLRHRVPDATRELADGNYRNTQPAYAVDAIALRWAENCELADLRLEMAGRHPVHLDSVYGAVLDELEIDGSWNKGEGGNGYVRFARTFHSQLRDSTVRNIRHVALQWSSAHNRITGSRIEVDVNFHGGFSHDNLVSETRIAPREGHPWPAVYRTPSDARWAPPDGANNVVEPVEPVAETGGGDGGGAP